MADDDDDDATGRDPALARTLTTFTPIDAVPLARGDHVLLDTPADQLPAVVGHAATHGRAVLVFYNGLLGPWLGCAALVQQDDGSWITLDGMPVVVTRTPPPVKEPDDA